MLVFKKRENKRQTLSGLPAVRWDMSNADDKVFNEGNHKNPGRRFSLRSIPYHQIKTS
jgi:hypothetical protein